MSPELPRTHAGVKGKRPSAGASRPLTPSLDRDERHLPGLGMASPRSLMIGRTNV